MIISTDKLYKYINIIHYEMNDIDIIIKLQRIIKNKLLIKKFNTNTLYCCGIDNIDEVISQNILVLFDDRRKLYEYEYWNEYEKKKYSYNYLVIKKKGDILIKDILIYMMNDSFYCNDDKIFNNHIFLEGFDKITDVQYSVFCGS